MTQNEILKEFRDFILRGNVVDLAIAVVLGLAFKAVVDSVVNNIITPLITMFGGKPNLTYLDFEINDAVFGYGSVLTEILSFVIIAAVIFFLIVKPMNMFLARNRKEEEAAAPPPTLSPEARQFLDELTAALQRIEGRG